MRPIVIGLRRAKRSALLKPADQVQKLRGRREPFTMQPMLREIPVQSLLQLRPALSLMNDGELDRRPVRHRSDPAFGNDRMADLDRTGAVLSTEEIDVSFPHAATSSFGYRSGRSSWRETLVARSSSKTRAAGTRSHWEIAFGVFRPSSLDLPTDPP